MYGHGGVESGSSTTLLRSRSGSDKTAAGCAATASASAPIRPPNGGTAPTTALARPWSRSRTSTAGELGEFHGPLLPANSPGPHLEMRTARLSRDAGCEIWPVGEVAALSRLPPARTRLLGRGARDLLRPGGRSGLRHVSGLAATFRAGPCRSAARRPLRSAHSASRSSRPPRRASAGFRTARNCRSGTARWSCRPRSRGDRRRSPSRASAVPA